MFNSQGCSRTGEKYDTLILTDRHDIPDVIQWEDTIGFTRHYHDRLLNGNSAARTFLYHSWLEIDKNNPSVWMNYERNALVAWECVASKVNLSLQAEGRPQNLKVLPAGAAFVSLVDAVLQNQVPGISGTTQEKLNLLFSDNVHPTELAWYYLSLVSYSAVMAKPAIGIAPPSGISLATSEAFQSMAWNFVNAYYNRPNAGVRTMSECTSYIPQNVCPGFGQVRFLTDYKVASCQNHFNSSNPSRPFQWPDPNWKPWPSP